MTKLMWIVENTCDHPLLKGYDMALIELWSHGDKALRQYIVDGEGNLWLPSVETQPKHAKPIGKLIGIVPSDCSDEVRAKAIDFHGIAKGKKVAVFSANEGSSNKTSPWSSSFSN